MQIWAKDLSRQNRCGIAYKERVSKSTGSWWRSKKEKPEKTPKSVI